MDGFPPYPPRALSCRAAPHATPTLTSGVWRGQLLTLVGMDICVCFPGLPQQVATLDGLKQRNYCLAVLGARRLESRGWRACVSSEGLGDSPSSPLPEFRWLWQSVKFLGLLLHRSKLFLSSHGLLIRTPVTRFRAHPNPV